MNRQINNSFRLIVIALLLLLQGFHACAIARVIPGKPSPPRLVNDLAHMMTREQDDELEQKLLDFSNATSNEITIVTIDSLGDYDVSDYAIKLGKDWGVGKSGKNNGVVILASLQDHKINISSGKGLEGALTDLMCGRIIRNEMVPSFKQKDYFTGFSKAADAVIAVTKGEYKADAPAASGGHLPFKVILIAIVFIIIILRVLRGGGGPGGGSGLGNLATGFLIGNMLGGGGGFGGGRGGDGGGGGGGFGGFGGGDFGGGGASGSW